MPIYSPEREEKDGIPTLAKDFAQAFTDANAIIISFAEYNGSYTTAWKNTFDWASRIDMKVFQDKPMLTLSTSPGGRGGMGVLGHVKTVAPHFGGNIKGSLSVPSFYDNFDLEKGELTNAELLAALKAKVAKLA